MLIAGEKGMAKELLEVLFRDDKYDEIFFYDDLSDNLLKLLYGNNSDKIDVSWSDYRKATKKIS